MLPTRPFVMSSPVLGELVELRELASTALRLIDMLIAPCERIYT